MTFQFKYSIPAEYLILFFSEVSIVLKNYFSIFSLWLLICSSFVKSCLKYMMTEWYYVDSFSSQGPCPLVWPLNICSTSNLFFSTWNNFTIDVYASNLNSSIPWYLFYHISIHPYLLVFIFIPVLWHLCL